MAPTQAEVDDTSSKVPGRRPDAARPGLPPRAEQRNDAPPESVLSQDGQTKTEDTHVSIPTLVDGFSSLSLDTTTMFRALASIFQAAHVHEDGVDVSHLEDGRDTWAVLRHGDELESQGVYDVHSLAAVREVLDTLCRALSRLFFPAVRIIADSSRDVSWRGPLGESGILGLALEVVASDDALEDVKTQCLRLVGNSCADTDENRARVVSDHQIGHILQKVRSPTMASVAVPVLFNICCDYEPAQEEAVKVGLYPTLIEVIRSGTLDSSPALGYLCRLFELGSKHLDASQSPDDAVEILLQCATKPGLDVDDSVSLVDSAIAHLQLEQFQKHMVEKDLFGVPLRYLVRSYFPKAILSGTQLPSVDNSSGSTNRDSDEEAEISRVRKALIQALSDVSALPEFSRRHISLATPLLDSLCSWLTAALPHIQLCSCIVLGNLARNDQTCEAMVSLLGIHKDLISIVTNSSDSTVLHAALGFLRNLALPSKNKVILGESGLVGTLARFWKSDFMPQIVHSAASVGRQLVIGCFPNVERITNPLSSDPDSPAHNRTSISLLISVSERNDEVAVKTEIARTVAAIIRCINAAPSLTSDSRNTVLDSLYDQHKNIAIPLTNMVTQAQYPVVRSEGWFAMALMGRHPKGAALINEVITEVNVFTALEEAVTRHAPEAASSSATPASDTDAETSLSSGAGVPSEDMKAKDRENAIILINELLQHPDGDLLSDIRRSTLEDLLQKGA